MDKLSFNNCTIPVGKMCNASSLNAALKCFTQINKKGYVSLERVQPGGQIVWVSRHLGRVIATLPVFADETTDTSFNQMSMEPLKGGELFCHGEYFYRTYLNFNNEIGIRAVLIFPDEILVRKACRLKGFEPTHVELIQFYTGEPRQYLTTGWLVECAHASPMFICFDLTDRLRFDCADHSQMVYVTVDFKQRFHVNGSWYTLERDDRGLWYVAPRSSRPRIRTGTKKNA
jgi:hypothetical protein